MWTDTQVNFISPVCVRLAAHHLLVGGHQRGSILAQINRHVPPQHGSNDPAVLWQTSHRHQLSSGLRRLTGRVEGPKPDWPHSPQVTPPTYTPVLSSNRTQVSVSCDPLQQGVCVCVLQWTGCDLCYCWLIRGGACHTCSPEFLFCFFTERKKTWKPSKSTKTSETRRNVINVLQKNPNKPTAPSFCFYSLTRTTPPTSEADSRLTRLWKPRSMELWHQYSPWQQVNTEQLLVWIGWHLSHKQETEDRNVDDCPQFSELTDARQSAQVTPLHTSL